MRIVNILLVATAIAALGAFAWGLIIHKPVPLIVPPGDEGDPVAAELDNMPLAEDPEAQTGLVDDISVEDEEEAAQETAAVEAGAAYLDQIRQLPGAAPLVDEIVAFFKRDAEEGSEVVNPMDNLEVDESGAAILGEDMTGAMIKDPEVRAKWDQLQQIIAQAHKDGTLKAR